jgi:hypothetical protein
VAEEGARDMTMIISEIEDPWLISWIRLHPEKYERAQNPDEMAKGIFMADAVAALEYKTVKTLGSTRLSTVQVETLGLKNIMNEVILMFQWHFYSATDIICPFWMIRLTTNTECS